MFKPVKSRFLFVAALATALVLSAATANAATKAPLKIAFVDPLSGPMAALGHNELAQFQFYAKLFNKNGGIAGHKVEIIPFDNKLSTQQTLVQFQKAVGQGIRYIALSNGDPFASVMMNAVNKHNKRNPDDRVLYLNYGAIGPEFVNARCTFWAFLFDANLNMKMNILTDWIAKQKDIHKVYLLNQDYSFGHRFAKAAVEMLKKKRPDIKIVGDIFTPLGKVKDFTPYVTQIKVSGADAVLTGNWGSDMTLLVKAAASVGLNVPFLTYYGGLVGVATEVGKNGVDRIYQVSGFNGDYKNPVMAKRETALNKMGAEFVDMRVTYPMEMLKEAVEKAGSIDPTKVAFALEGLQYNGPMGPAYMRAKNHQIEIPTFISVMKDNMKYGLEKTNLNFHAIDKFSAKQGELPTTCQMHRPKRPK